MSVTELASLPEPAPTPTQLGGWVTPGGITVITGDLNACPTLALALATALTTGTDFGPLATVAGYTVYASSHSQAYVSRRAYRVARGFGLPKPPEGLGFYSLDFTRDDATFPNKLVQATQPPYSTLVIEGLADKPLANTLAVLQRYVKTTIAFATDADAIKRTCPLASVVEAHAFGPEGRIEFRQVWNANGPLVPAFSLDVEQTDNATRFVPAPQSSNPPLRLTSAQSDGSIARIS